jgi:hypothetical protein
VCFPEAQQHVALSSCEKELFLENTTLNVQKMTVLCQPRIFTVLAQSSSVGYRRQTRRFITIICFITDVCATVISQLASMPLLTYITI